MPRRRGNEAGTLPKLNDEIAAGEFWDTHSPLDYAGQFEEVEVTFQRPTLKRGLTIKLEADTIQQLRKLASEKGIGPTTLVRMWILDRLKAHQRGTAGS